jgi:hypothetical protein
MQDNKTQSSENKKTAKAQGHNNASQRLCGNSFTSVS